MDASCLYKVTTIQIRKGEYRVDVGSRTSGERWVIKKIIGHRIFEVVIRPDTCESLRRVKRLFRLVVLVKEKEGQNPFFCVCERNDSCNSWSIASSPLILHTRRSGHIDEGMLSIAFSVHRSPGVGSWKIVAERNLGIYWCRIGSLWTRCTFLAVMPLRWVTEKGDYGG